jgi:hypothetical protein
MTTAVIATSHASARAAISAHFAGRASPSAEAEMREHLPTCSACRACYRRHHLLARLDPAGLAAEERLARGLGFGGRRAAGTPRWLVLGLPLAGAAAAVALVVGTPSHRSPGDHTAAVEETPVARGPASATGPAPRLLIYRFAAHSDLRTNLRSDATGGAAARAPELVERSMRGDDELAFAYTNPAGRRYVAIFGVDEDSRIYWFHPTWPVGAPAPRAIPAAPGPGPHELSGAIRHQVAGRRFVMHAAFADRPFAVEEIEAAVRAGVEGGDIVSHLGPDVLVTDRALDVRP